MVKISVIIPAYNASNTLARTIESVQAALLKVSAASEIVVVDDGSKDGTKAIIDALIEKQESQYSCKLIALHQQNAGAYTARNNGVVTASGEWIGFVDADDEVEPELYVKLLTFADKNDLQVAECDIAGYTKRGRDKDFWIGKQQVYEELVIPWLIEGNEASFMWDKIYRRDIWPTTMHSSHIFMYDDLMTNLQVFRNVDRFGVLHEPLYHYQVNAGSSIRRFGKRNIRDFLEIAKFRKEACLWYGIAPCDFRMKHWYQKNFVNNIKLAIRAFLKI